jgi:2-iminobutanoate/2-iminopropanoate deaminase
LKLKQLRKHLGTTRKRWRLEALCTSQANSQRADGASLADQPFEVQARQALANVIAIVEGAGLGCDRIAKVTAYLVGVEHWPTFNAIYAEVLGNHRPARAVVPVPALHHGYLIELEAIAVR